MTHGLRFGHTAAAGATQALGVQVRALEVRAPEDFDTVLPVEQPMRFEFVVNMKTAQTLGIIFPNKIML